MSKQTTAHDSDATPVEGAGSAGARTAEVNHNPSVSAEDAPRGGEGKAPNAAGGPAPSTVEEHIPSTSDPNPTDLPSANKPVPD